MMSRSVESAGDFVYNNKIGSLGGQRSEVRMVGGPLRIGTGVLSAAILLALAAFALWNLNPVQAQVFGRLLTIDQWAIVMTCAALGCALGVLLAAPRWLAAGRLEREMAHLRAHAADLEQRHAEMLREYEIMQAERDLLNTRVGQLTRYAGTRLILGDQDVPPSTPR